MKRSDEYFAGLFDGEGTIGIYAAGDSWSLRIALVGTYRPMIESAYNHFKVGSFRTSKRQAKTTGTPRGDIEVSLCKQGWRWSVTSRIGCKEVLTRLRPWLQEKGCQADTAIQFLNGEISGVCASKALKDQKKFEFHAIEGEHISDHNNKAGELNGSARTTYATAEIIRGRVKNGECQADIARELKMSKTMVNRIVLGKTYTHAPRLVYGIKV